MELKSLALQKGTFSPLDDRDAVTRRPSLLAGASRVFEASGCISQSNSPQTPLLTGTNLARYLDLHGAWEAAISQRKAARPCRHPPAMTPRQASLLSCCLALSRAAAGDCEPASKALRAFFDSPGPATAVFAADQVVASRGACVSQSRDGRRSTWFAAGDDGARDLRRAWCAPRRVERRNGTRGAAISRRFSAVAPYAAKTRRAAQRWRLYKRCGALNRRGRPHDHEHVDLEEAAPARVVEARRVDAIVVLLSDRLANVGHAVRDVLFLRAFAGAWACGGEQEVLYSLYLAPRNPQPPLPWVRELSEAVAASTGTRGFSPRPGEVVCVRGLVQKAAQHVGDAHTARHARAAALRRCGVELEAPATTVLYVVHGASREGSRRLGNHEAVIAALDGVAQNKGLRLDVAELGALSFCGQVRAVHSAHRRRRLRRRGRRQLNFHARHRHDGRTDRVRPLGAARARRRHARPHVPAVRCGVRVRLRVVLPMRRRPGRRPDGEALDAARLVQVRAPRRERRRAGERRRQRARRRPRGRRARGGRSAALRDIETGCCVYLCPGRQLSVPPPRAARASPA